MPQTHQDKFLASISEALLFWSNLILTLVPRISTRAGRRWPSQSLPWGLFAHCFHVCLRKRQPQEKELVLQSPDTLLALQPEKASENIFYLFHTEQNAPSKWCICSATVTNSASSLCSPIPKCLQGQGCRQNPWGHWEAEEGDGEVNTTNTAEAAQEGLHHLH